VFQFIDYGKGSHPTPDYPITGDAFVFLLALLKLGEYTTIISESSPMPLPAS
jgi:hypothetical protein